MVKVKVGLNQQSSSYIRYTYTLQKILLPFVHIYVPRGSLLILVQGEKKKFCWHHSLYSGHCEVGASHGSSV